MASGSHRSGSNASSSQGSWWEAVEIVDEDGKQYRVRWAGKDPKTGKPWPLDWLPNSHCSPDLIRNWEKKKAKGKKQESPASASVKYLVAYKPLSSNRDAASTSDPPVPIPTTRKRKHSTPSGSTDNATEGSTPSRRKRLAPAIESAPSGGHGGQSTAPAHALTNRKKCPTTTEDLPSHPPLEDIEMWVPTPNAKFGPPKRKRTAGKRRDPPKAGHVDTAVPAKIPVPTPIPSPYLALTNPPDGSLPPFRNSKLQSQSQPTSNQPGETINGSATSGLLPPTGRAKDDIQPKNPNVNNGRGSETSGRGANSQSHVPDLVKKVLGVTDDSLGHRFNPLLPSPLSLFRPNPLSSTNSSSKSPRMEKSMQGEGVNTEDTNLLTPHIPAFNVNPPASAVSPTKFPQTVKSVKIGPPRTKKPGTSSTKQRSSSKSEPSQTGKGALANRRTYEALVRLNELRRAGKQFAAKDHPTSETSQGPEQLPPHVVFKQAMDGMKSPDASQVTHLGNSANEISAGTSPGRNRTVDPSKSGLVTNKSGQNMGSSRTGSAILRHFGNSANDIWASEPLGDNRTADPSKSQEVIKKSGQDVNVASLSRTGGELAAKVLVPSSQDEVPPTASNSTQSQSHDPLPHASLDSQLASALDLLHKKSEEISDLRIQVNMLRVQSTEQAGNEVSHGKEAIDYVATEVQTDRDNEAYKDWDLERTRWAEEKHALQGEAGALRGEKERALADVDFFRAQYQKASDFASSTRLENEELSARATLAESQATKGVALVRATFEGRITKLEAEVQKHKALSEMLTERARRTDDDVRYRAALAPEFEREFRQLEGRFGELEAELDETKDELSDEKRVSSKLRRQLARLQAAGAGQSTEQAQDHSLWSDEKDDDDYNPTSSPREDSDGSSPESQREEDHSPHNEDDAGAADAEMEQLDSFGLGESAQSGNDDVAYLCRWRPGEPAENCDAVMNTKEELHEHVLSHHLACH